MSHYAIAPNGAVFSFKKLPEAEAAATEMGGHVASDATEQSSGLEQVPTPMLVMLHNAIRPEKPVTRFADRKTAETRLKGVLEVLAKPGQKAAPAETTSATTDTNPAQGAEETEDMATTKTKGKRAAKKATTKTARTPRVQAANIPDATVKKIIKMRADGTKWPEILAEYGETNAFIHRIRPLMKAIDKSSVKKMGPGSPNYGKGKKAK